VHVYLVGDVGSHFQGDPRTEGMKRPRFHAASF
jgi:hypothetical protein